MVGIEGVLLPVKSQGVGGDMNNCIQEEGSRDVICTVSEETVIFFFVSKSGRSAINLEAFLLLPYLFSAVMSCHCL